MYITEKVDRKTGWQFICLEEEWTRGYQQEMQDFMECAATGRQPLSGLDLAYQAVRVHYAAYWPPRRDVGSAYDGAGRMECGRVCVPALTITGDMQGVAAVGTARPHRRLEHGRPDLLHACAAVSFPWKRGVRFSMNARRPSR